MCLVLLVDPFSLYCDGLDFNIRDKETELCLPFLFLFLPFILIPIGWYMRLGLPNWILGVVDDIFNTYWA